MWNDLRFTLRAHRKAPAFTVMAVFVLALGIGLNTAIFSVINAALFAMPAVPNAGELRYIYTSNWRLFGIYQRDFQFLRANQDVFEELASEARDEAKFGSGGGVHMVRGEQVSSNYFKVLQLEAAQGRTFSADDDGPQAPLVAVISDAFWASEFNRDPNILGRRMRLTYRYVDIDVQWPDYTIVGVMPPGFRGIGNPFDPTQYWVPATQRVRDHSQRSRTGGQSRVGTAADAAVGLPFGRLRPGVSDARASLVVRTLGAQTESAARNVTARLTPTSEEFKFELEMSDARRIRLPFDPAGEIVPARVAAGLIAIAALVLLIATTNLTGMVMARGVVRRVEIATKLMLGANRARLVRQLAVEGLLLAFLAGVVGLGLARILIVLFVDQMASPFGQYASVPISFDVPIDVNVLTFTALTCVLAGLLTSLAPARQAWRARVLDAAGGGATSTSRRGRLRHWILVPQVATSVALLLAAGAVSRPLLQSLAEDPGYAAERVAYVDIDYPSPNLRPSDEVRQAFLARRTVIYRQMLEQAARTPGITKAAMTEGSPAQVSQTWVVKRDGYQPDSRHWWVSSARVTPEYFQTMDMRLIQGRPFDAGDSATSAPVAIVCERLAQWLWPGQNAVGQHLAMHWPDSPNAPRWVEVVGVVNEVRAPLTTWGNPYVYFPAWQNQNPYLRTLVAQGNLSTGDLIRALRDVAAGADPGINLMASGTMAQAIANKTYPRRIAAGLLSLSGLFGLVLAAIGVYGVVSYSVAQRTRELGIRATLGAGRGRLMGLVFREGGLVALLGMILGAGLAFGGLKLASRALPGVPSLDPAAGIAVPIVIGLVIALACFIPARRAAAVDPIAALRQ